MNKYFDFSVEITKHDEYWYTYISFLMNGCSACIKMPKEIKTKKQATEYVRKIINNSYTIKEVER
jgi:thioredoxin-related protein